MTSKQNSRNKNTKHGESIDRIVERLSYLDPKLDYREHNFDIDGKHGELDYLIIHHHRALIFETKASIRPKRVKRGRGQLVKAERFVRHNYPFIDSVYKFYVHYKNGVNTYYRI